MIPYNLNQRQQEAVNMPINRPLLIVAGAGSGKTATLTRRLEAILKGGVDPQKIVAITFTNKAAEEMKERILALESLPPSFAKQTFVGTFHSFGARILRREASHVGRHANFTIFDSNDTSRLIRQVVKSLNINKQECGPSYVASQISALKNNLLDLEEFSNSKNPKKKVIPSAFEKYEAFLRESNGFDFDDLIQKPVEIFKANPAVLSKYQKFFSHFLVDEYQDINESQYQLLRLLVGSSGNLNVVGDDNQAIYGFRGANFKNFLNFDSDFKNANVVVLDQNYRSTKNIINSASAVIANNREQRPKKLWTDNSDGLPVKVVERDSEEDESYWIMNQASSLLKKGIKNIAVLYRTNAQSRSLEQAFIENSIPYRIFGGLKFYDRKEIKDLVSALRYASNPLDLISLERMDKAFYKQPFRELRETLPLQAKHLPPTELLDYIIKTSNYLPYLEKNFPNSDERIANIVELVSFATSFPDLKEFLNKVSLFQSSDGSPKKNLPPSSPAVTFMTIHLSKGLEFDNVFVSGVSEGLLPHQMSYQSPAEIEEERRLMYVAMTRAKQRLFISFFDIPSRFISEIPSSSADFSVFRSLDDEDRYISI